MTCKLVISLPCACTSLALRHPVDQELPKVPPKFSPCLRDVAVWAYDMTTLAGERDRPTSGEGLTINSHLQKCITNRLIKCSPLSLLQCSKVKLKRG